MYLYFLFFIFTSIRAYAQAGQAQSSWVRAVVHCLAVASRPHVAGAVFSSLQARLRTCVTKT